jgi:hypothetical protein
LTAIPQKQQVLDLLVERGEAGLTALDALAIVGTMRLAARIADLREDGWNIESRDHVTPKGARVALYILRPTMGQQAGFWR